MAGKKYIPISGLLVVASIAILTVIKPFRHIDQKITPAAKQQAMVGTPVLPPPPPSPPPPPVIRYTSCVFPVFWKKLPDAQ